ncbi:MAG TPA: proline racemase, partial [Firmicutes bacterium]|nr:proline racemase [Bacillota bacterium]
MRARMVIHCVDSHTAGEPTRVVVAGLPPIPGRTMAEKKTYLQAHHDTVRCGLLREPRGHHDMFGAILLPPTRPEAALGVVFMDNGGYLSMCGHGTIGVVTTALETGIIPSYEPVTEVVIDTPAGLVYTRALVEKGRVREVTFRNVPAFVFRRDLPVTVPGWGEVRVDVAFGGNFFAIVSARELHLALQPRELDTLVQLGIRIRDAVNATLPVRHPSQRHLTGVELVEFSEPLEPPVPALEPAGLRTPAG